MIDNKTLVEVKNLKEYFNINTGMFNGVKSRIIPILKPEYVCKRVIRAIEKGEDDASLDISSY